MDVSLSGRLFLLFFLFTFLVACGNRFDLSKERGRQARIDEANYFLSQENCGAAIEAINPLYGSAHVTDEVRIIRASAEVCYANFRLLTMASSIAGASNFFLGMAKSLSTQSGANAQSVFYGATDIMTRSGAAMAASSRTTRENTFMVFLQMGVISSILRNYGGPDATGAQTADLVYSAVANPAGEMANADACALTAAFAILSDSFAGSSLNDGDTSSLNNSLNTVCAAAGFSSCSDMNKNRSLCDGTNTNSQTAQLVVTAVNAAW